MESIASISKKDSDSQPDPVALAAKLMISKIRKHIEHDNCRCCKEALTLEETDK